MRKRGWVACGLQKVFFAAYSAAGSNADVNFSPKSSAGVSSLRSSVFRLKVTYSFWAHENAPNVVIIFLCVCRPALGDSSRVGNINTWWIAKIVRTCLTVSLGLNKHCTSGHSIKNSNDNIISAGARKNICKPHGLVCHALCMHAQKFPLPSLNHEA